MYYHTDSSEPYKAEFSKQIIVCKIDYALFFCLMFRVFSEFNIHMLKRKKYFTFNVRVFWRSKKRYHGNSPLT